ncbi:MAG: cytochrome c [Ignavibacteriae bacterium]|nr:cytochrome c [Ignavibacteriota bacterium]
MIVTFIAAVVINGCSSSSETIQKSGAQLWGENCVRCHNAPSPAAFSDSEWETITQHMQVRANLDSKKTRSILEFLKMAN